MTVKIVGHWERGWDTPWQEYNWWIHSIREFGVEEFYMTPVTGIGKTSVLERATIEEILSENSQLTHVYVDESATVELTDFVHPTNALYILGRTGYSPISKKTENDLAVKIPSIRNSGGFWAHQAITMVLYDRFLKETS